MSFRWLKAALAAALVLAAPMALASGFHIYEQGAKASAQAVAFIARANDPSANWYNPAGLVTIDRPTIALGGSLVFLGDTQFESNMDRINPVVFRGGTWDMEDNTGTPVHLYYVQPIGKDFVLGFGVTTPFGLVTEWSAKSDPRVSSRKADLESVVYNLNGAFNFGCGWSGAVGIDYIDATLNSFSRNIPLALVNPKFTSQAYADLSGDGDDFGWNAGVRFASETFAFGAFYRSGYRVSLDGQLTFTNVPNTPIGPGTNLRDLFPNSAASGTLDLPASYGAGVAFMPNKNWEFEFDIQVMEWSAFEELSVDVQKQTPVVGDIYQLENWDNTYSYRFGTSYGFGPAEAHELRAGAYYETSAIPTETLRPSIPDADRTGVSIGYGYNGKKFFIDAYYMYIWLDDVSTSRSEFLNDNSVLWGSYSSQLSLLGVTGGFRF
ncbi:MAG: outer membrane protein transport protein [Acidobacteria bacterium]|nr:outer membrane protein transport protein [Acidobacteriota bacterium]